MEIGRTSLYGLLAFAAGATLAQAPPKAGNPLPAPANVVTLNVIARDAREQPVGDLGVDDFQVTDQGKNQKITYFHRNQDNRPLVSPLGPHDYSNRPDAGVPHGVVILFDLLNASFSNRSYGADEIVRALEHLESPDFVYLYILTNAATLYPVHAFPEGGAAPPKGVWTQQVKTMLDEALREVTRLKPVDEKVPNLRVDGTYRALETIGTGMAPIPGRKDMIWITQGVPLVLRLAGGTSYDYTPQLQRLATRLDRAGITVNTVDQGEALGTGSKETIEAFPNLTGGKAYTQRSVEQAIPEVLASTRASYVIEYAAPPQDGKFHKIRVTAARKGIHLLSEQGYVNEPSASGIPGYETAAFSSPFDASGIGLWASLSTAPDKPQSVHLEVRVDSRDLLLQPRGDGFNVPLAIIFSPYPAQGQASVSNVNIALTKAQRDKPSKDDISISQDFNPGGVEKLRIIVFDRGSNAIGSLTIPVAP